MQIRVTSEDVGGSAFTVREVPATGRDIARY